MLNFGRIVGSLLILSHLFSTFISDYYSPFFSHLSILFHGRVILQFGTFISFDHYMAGRLKIHIHLLSILASFANPQTQLVW
ncbi:hypothetical protein LguiB_005829 [Lonicera macranthoides]